MRKQTYLYGLGMNRQRRYRSRALLAELVERRVLRSPHPSQPMEWGIAVLQADRCPRVHNLRPQDAGRLHKVAGSCIGSGRLALPLSGMRSGNTPKVRFSATLGQEPEIEAGLA